MSGSTFVISGDGNIADAIVAQTVSTQFMEKLRPRMYRYDMDALQHGRNTIFLANIDPVNLNLVELSTINAISHMINTGGDPVQTQRLRDMCVWKEQDPLHNYGVVLQGGNMQGSVFHTGSY